jgi:hypothetical protein
MTDRSFIMSELVTHFAEQNDVLRALVAKPDTGTKKGVENNLDILGKVVLADRYMIDILLEVVLILNAGDDVSGDVDDLQEMLVDHRNTTKGLAHIFNEPYYAPDAE